MRADALSSGWKAPTPQMVDAWDMRAICLAVLLSPLACGREQFHDACMDPPPGCPDAVMYTCNGRCYAICPREMTQPAASLACTEWGGCLTSVRSMHDNDCVASRLAATAWIGARQANEATVPGEGWGWCDGSTFSFTAWGFGEPNDGGAAGTQIERGSEQCAWISPGGDWNDEACDSLAHAVCAREP